MGEYKGGRRLGWNETREREREREVKKLINKSKR